MGCFWAVATLVTLAAALIMWGPGAVVAIIIFAVALGGDMGD